MERYPDAKFIAHPECEAHILEKADFIGSTSQLLKYTKENAASTFIVATESGILHQMELASPAKHLFLHLPTIHVHATTVRT